MKNYRFIVFYLLCHVGVFALHAQDAALVLSLEKAVEIAREQSPDVLYARHKFRSQYWDYCYYKANYLPSLRFTSTPNFNHRINAITMQDGTSEYVQQNMTLADATLFLNQNIALTGGSLSVKTSIQRMDILNNQTHSYMTSPVLIGYSQSLFGYNNLKWDRKIEPVRFEAAKKEYVEMLEYVSVATINRFFNLARAQTNLAIATYNYAQADTLYSFAQRRYNNIGNITENELLQLEIQHLSEESNMLNAQIEVDDCMQALRAYLGIKEASQIVVSINNEVPQFMVDFNHALQLALSNNSDILAITLRKMESESSVARAKASAGLKADVYAQFGLTQSSSELGMAYRNPLNQQYVEIGLSLPILDWGRGKGQVRVAQSRRDMVNTQAEQTLSNFEQNMMRIVKQFNLQNGNVVIAAKTDQIAERRNEVARRLYLLERSSILDLNASITEKDAAKRNYISALNTFWALYYTLRSLTLYDFEKGIALTEDYEMLIK